MPDAKTRFTQASAIYEKIGINAGEAVKKLADIPISIHCWQGDDVAGFEGASTLSGGIAATGNYPGRARNIDELMADMDAALALIPGKHRINLHAIYGDFNEAVDRDKIEPAHFAKWVDFAKKRGLGLDFNPTFFSHPKAAVATLSSRDENIRKFWIEHGKRCLKIAEYFANELGGQSLMNIWIPDGFKDIPADRLTPRKLLKDSLDQILATPYDKSKVYVSVESKVFGIGAESYTVGSHEFYMNYAAFAGVLCLLDNGHYHPTEVVSDKISSILAFSDKVALHVTRPVRWDSDHVVRLDDEIKEIAKEIVAHGADKVLIGLDFFDASINRIAAWVIGVRNMQKALLAALLTPHEHLAELQKQGRNTEVMMLQEELKTYPMGCVWDYFCEQNDVPFGASWYDNVITYEKEVLQRR